MLFGDDIVVVMDLVRFWRSHHEEWPKQKQMLQADQREALNELLIAPSYYA